MSHLESRINGEINAKKLVIGKGVVVEEGVVITGKEGPAEEVILGDFCYIGHNTKIIVPKFRLGDYSKFNANGFAHGYKPMQIGRNCWFGGNIVLDSIGGLVIDDNICIGTQSHIWTHQQFGDVVEGCRFFSNKYLHIAKDVWIGGHCTIAPVRLSEKSMILAGSVLTKDTIPNHIYAGVPAKDVTDKMGTQFEERTIEQKRAKLQEFVDAFNAKYPKFLGQIKIVSNSAEIEDGICCFNVSNRTYTKTFLEAEVMFLKANTPLIKFTPVDEPSFITLPPNN